MSAEPVAGRGVIVDASGCDADNLCWSGGVLVTVGGAESWPALVERAAAEGWLGVERLGGFAGTVGEAVAANVAAEGHQVADTIWSVRTGDRHEGAQRTFPMVDCGFSPGGSRLSPERFIVLDAAFLFREG